MAQTPRGRQHRDYRSTREEPTVAPDQEAQTDEDIAVSDPQSADAPQGTVHQADVAIDAQGEIDPEQQSVPPEQAQTEVTYVPSHNTPPPEGVPEPPPVIDRTTVLKQAATFISDAVAVANWRLTPGDASAIEQRLAQLFDEDNNTPAEDLADLVANEHGMNPEWDVQGAPTRMTIQATQTQ